MTEDDIMNAEITEITDLDVSPTDRVFTALGYFVKVRRVPTGFAIGFGEASFLISGSQTNSEGWALPHEENDFRIAQPFTWTLTSNDVTTSPADQLLAILHDCVRQVLRAINVQDALATL